MPGTLHLDGPTIDDSEGIYYPPLPDKLMEKIVNKTVDDIKSAVQERSKPSSRTETLPLSPKVVGFIQANKHHFLQRAVRGYMAEFMRQTAEHIRDLNNSANLAHVNEDLAGRSHSIAVLAWMLKQSLPSWESQEVLGHIIKKSVRNFLEGYPDEMSFPAPQASIKYQLGRIVERAGAAAREWCMQQSNSTDPSNLTR